MSGTVGGIGGFAFQGTLGTLVDNAAESRARLDTLTEQSSTGLKGQTFAGLGEGARVSLDLRPALAHADALKTGIDAAAGRLQVTQTAMTQLQSIASDFNAKLNDLNGLDPTELDSVAASARTALQQVASLLDSRDGDTYVFAGQDTANPPVPAPNDILSSGFYTQIAAAVGGLSANGAAATASATLAIASSNAPGTSPFSAYQSQPAAVLQAGRPTVETGAARVPAGLLASANASAVSTGGSTTGSYMRDLMRALATLGSLTGQNAGSANVQSLVGDLRTSLGGAISAMATDAGALGDTQASLTATSTRLGDTATALTAQVSGAEDVDMAATLSALSQAQTQLQSSYQIISRVASLSLANYLTSA
jgi:flagellin-like hook-associated protein FlgL